MCTIAILVGVCDAPLVVAANRDEMYARSTRPPETLAPGIVGGVDAVSGGTWLAVRADGSFAAVTNQRALTPPPPQVRSRGLVVKELAASSDRVAYVRALDPRHYASMNLAWGDTTGAYVAYLRHDRGTNDVVRLPDGVHVLCNDTLGAPGFPRGDRLRAGIHAALTESPTWDHLARHLPILLADHTLAEPTAGVAQHLSPDLARALTATCIHTEIYGTRSATLAAFDPGSVRAYLHADGPPCVTPFADRRGLLAAA